jgi:hypothetical protein
MRMLWMIPGGLIAMFICWIITRIGKFSHDIDQDMERMFRKWLREHKKEAKNESR